MWRPFFLGLGATLACLGVECMVLDHVVMAAPSKPVAAPTSFLPMLEPPQTGKVITPPDWAPWSLLSAGAVVILYSFTIPQRMEGG